MNTEIHPDRIVNQLGHGGRIVRRVKVLERWYGGWRVEALSGPQRGLRYAVRADSLRPPTAQRS